MVKECRKGSNTFSGFWFHYIYDKWNLLELTSYILSFVILGLHLSYLADFDKLNYDFDTNRSISCEDCTTFKQIAEKRQHELNILAVCILLYPNYADVP